MWCVYPNLKNMFVPFNKEHKIKDVNPFEPTIHRVVGCIELERDLSTMLDPSHFVLLLRVPAQPGANLPQWGALGPNSIQGNHARLLHGNESAALNLPSSGPPNNLPSGAMPRPSNPTPSGSMPPPSSERDGPLGSSQNQQEASEFRPQFSQLASNPLFSGSQPKGFTQDLLRPLPDPMRPSDSSTPLNSMNPQNASQTGGNMGSVGNSVLNAAWLSNFQRSSLPPNHLYGSQMPIPNLSQDQQARPSAPAVASCSSIPISL